MHNLALDLVNNNKRHLKKMMHDYVTVLEYVPIRLSDIKGEQLQQISGMDQAGDGSCSCNPKCDGRSGEYLLFDISAFQEDDEKIIVQLPSGLSKDAQDNSAFAFGSPLSLPITSVEQKDYVEKNACKAARKAQMSVEIKRMELGGQALNTPKVAGKIARAVTAQHVSDARARSEENGWAPPLGHSIWLFPLAPYAKNAVAKERQPFLGSVYVLLPDDLAVDIELAGNIGHVAQIAARHLVVERIKKLFGTFKDGNSTSSLARFMFGHHWFYSHEPSALQLLYAVVGYNDTLLDNIYIEFGWPVPPKDRLKNTVDNKEVDKLLKSLSADLEQLRAYAGVSLKVPDNFESIIWQIATNIAGSQKEREVDVDHVRRNCVYFCPAVIRGNAALWGKSKNSVLLFEKASFNTLTIKNYEKLLEAAAPCDKTKTKNTDKGHSQNPLYGLSNGLKNNEIVFDTNTDTSSDDIIPDRWLRSVAVYRHLVFLGKIQSYAKPVES